ncbi:PREDICTED: translation initiation factor IF-3, chloroplastic-like [Fragaria vesca subsp. vesca]|uniref:translation initiation factor IF-3, chloroplastic-like n=1 Tax=Fragaria vesca subsp. vesca TaxID=101020 RepID=UPI0002C3105D|nr:PREDICTED: translation initiation factor IF-3, chloroplastic-like [Fragaria vesca subsp. vesca]
MAGITTSFASKPILSKTTPFHSSFSSKLFGLRFNHVYLINSSSCSSLSSSAITSPVTARFGGGGPRRSSNDRRRQQSDAEDDDKALDISSIRSATVRLIDQKQEMVGVVSKSEAIRMADEADLDLVILSPDADPPVLRIMDYNKYRYEQQKKKRVSQKKSAASRMDLKELKMGYNIDQHDYSVRMRAAQKFLKDGDKVKVIVNLKGRENEFRNKAIELLKRFQSEVGELATEEAKSFSDRNMFIVLVPNKAILQKAQEPSKKKENPAVNEVSSSV